MMIDKVRMRKKLSGIKATPRSMWLMFDYAKNEIQKPTVKPG
jgi:hypothetical protein